MADLTLRDAVPIAFLRCIDGDDAGDGLRAAKFDAPSDKWDERFEIRLAKEFSSLRDVARHLEIAKCTIVYSSVFGQKVRFLSSTHTVLLHLTFFLFFPYSHPRHLEIAKCSLFTQAFMVLSG